MEIVNTGDVLLFSSNTVTGFILRTATSSMWNHLGIAVRVRITPEGTPEVTCSLQDTLCVLELNAVSRFDLLTGELNSGMTLSKFQDLSGGYNHIVVRKLREPFRNHPRFLPLINDFIKKYREYVFADRAAPFLGV